MARAAGQRTDTAWRVIRASPRTIYEALLDPLAVAQWRPPEGMTMEIAVFEPRIGGVFRMSLRYANPEHGERGKTTDDGNVVIGRFLALVPGKRVVERVMFESDDPAMAGEMTMVTSLEEVAGGTEVTIRCENVPRGIRASDHQKGIAATLKNLAAWTE